MPEEKRRPGQRRSKTMSTTNDTTIRNTIKEAAASLRGQTRAFVAEYLQGGKWEGDNYVVLSPLREDKRPGSFKINKDGFWKDYSTGESGDLLNLFQRMKQYSTPKEAVQNLPSHLLGSPIDVSFTLRDEEWSYCKPTPSDYPPKIQHPELGAPQEIYEFRDIDGSLIGLRARFIKSNKKEIRSYTLFRSRRGRKMWRCAGLPRDEFKNGYPLYGAEKLAKNPDAIFLVEGERTANKAQELIPQGAISMTIYGGCQSVHLADFSLLKERQVVIWPDADEPGEKFAQSAAKRIAEAGGEVLGFINTKLFLKDRDSLPEGYDAADAVEEGFTAEWFLERLDSKQLLLTEMPPTPDETEEEEQYGPFRVVPGVGVLYCKSQNTEIRLCSELRVLGTCADINNENWATRVSFSDGQGVKKVLVIPREDIISGHAVKDLGNKGLPYISMGQGDKRHLQEYLQLPGKSFSRIVSRTGWFSDQGCYVLPGETIGSYSENGKETEVSLASDYAYSVSFDQSGTLEDWQREVSSLCPGNSRLILAVCIALAGPLLKPLGKSSGGIHLVSASSTGKTSALHVANSVWRSPAGVGTWNGTQHGIAAAAAAANDGLLILDEIGEVDKKLLGQIVYQLGNTVERKRANNFGGALTGLGQQEAARVMTLSTGETGLRETMADAGFRVHAGMEIRLVDLPADAGADMGILEVLHGEDGSAAFINRLRSATSTYYGTAARAFILHLIEDMERSVKEAKHHIETFLGNYLPEDAKEQVGRVANHFAVIAASGELATSFGITGWQAGEALVSVGRCFHDWIQQRGGTGQIEEANLIAQVREFLERFRSSRFLPLSIDEAEIRVRRLNDQAGCWRDEKGKDGYGNFLVQPEVFRKELCQGFNRKFAIDVLVKLGYLLNEGKSRNVHVRATGQQPRFYEISSDIFDGE